MATGQSWWRTLLFAMAALGLAACTERVPSQAEAERLIQRQFASCTSRGSAVARYQKLLPHNTPPAMDDGDPQVRKARRLVQWVNENIEKRPDDFKLTSEKSSGCCFKDRKYQHVVNGIPTETSVTIYNGVQSFGNGDLHEVRVTIAYCSEVTDDVTILDIAERRPKVAAITFKLNRKVTPLQERLQQLGYSDPEIAESPREGRVLMERLDATGWRLAL